MGSSGAAVPSSPATAPAREASRQGEGGLVARAVRGRTVLAEAHATAPLRYVVPTFPAQTGGASVCLVTFGGGLVDGDRIAVDVVVERGATLVLFTQASTKAFRGTTEQTLRARVAGTLVVLFDPVACFAGARFTQETAIALEDDGACVVLDGLTSGRPAYGERWAMDRVTMRTRVSHRSGASPSADATRWLDDAVVLDAEDAPIAPRLGDYDALLTVSAFGARARSIQDALLEPARHPRGASVAVAPSEIAAARGTGALVRIAAHRPASALEEARRRLRNLPEIDAVDTFAARR